MSNWPSWWPQPKSNSNNNNNTASKSGSTPNSKDTDSQDDSFVLLKRHNYWRGEKLVSNSGDPISEPEPEPEPKPNPSSSSSPPPRNPNPPLEPPGRYTSADPSIRSNTSPSISTKSARKEQNQKKEKEKEKHVLDKDGFETIPLDDDNGNRDDDEENNDYDYVTYAANTTDERRLNAGSSSICHPRKGKGKGKWER
ncbi:hypothetical protein F5Y08DRAFT_346145 [Xylaria arbuscula]|nr:hypothetical protein F5Y08DRAFT_346145 [Xylaria arbuscula]